MVFHGLGHDSDRRNWDGVRVPGTRSVSFGLGRKWAAFLRKTEAQRTGQPNACPSLAHSLSCTTLVFGSSRV